MTTPLETVILFHDADSRCLGMLEVHLSSLEREGLLRVWHRGKMLPGEVTAAALQERLEKAHIVLLLVSADFNASYSTQNMDTTRVEQGLAAHVVPIIARPCNLNGLFFSDLHSLPADAKPLMEDEKLSESRLHAAVMALRDLATQFITEAQESAQPPRVVGPAVSKTLMKLEVERNDLAQSVLRLRRAVADATATALDNHFDSQVVDLASELIARIPAPTATFAPFPPRSSSGGNSTAAVDQKGKSGDAHPLPPSPPVARTPGKAPPPQRPSVPADARRHRLAIWFRALVVVGAVALVVVLVLSILLWVKARNRDNNPSTDPTAASEETRNCQKLADRAERAYSSCGAIFPFSFRSSCAYPKANLVACLEFCVQELEMSSCECVRKPESPTCGKPTVSSCISICQNAVPFFF